jgi:hypothetical protein
MEMAFLDIHTEDDEEMTDGDEERKAVVANMLAGNMEVRPEMIPLL